MNGHYNWTNSSSSTLCSQQVSDSQAGSFTLTYLDECGNVARNYIKTSSGVFNCPDCSGLSIVYQESATSYVFQNDPTSYSQFTRTGSGAAHAPTNRNPPLRRRKNAREGDAM